MFSVDFQAPSSPSEHTKGWGISTPGSEGTHCLLAGLRPAWIQPLSPISGIWMILNPTCSSPGSRCQNLPSSSTYTVPKYTHRAVMSPPPAGPDSFTTTTPSPAAPDPFFLNIFPSTRKLPPFSPVHCPLTRSHKTICMAHAAGENNGGVQSESWTC